MNIFEILLTQPFFNLLFAFYKVFESLSIPGALGFAVILLTVSIRLVLWPLTTHQLKSGQKMAALKPHLDRIKEEHGHDKVRHQQEVASLYKQHGVNPLAGCLPLILQIPVFIALYNVLLKTVALTGPDALAAINQKLYSSSLYLDKIPQASFLGADLSAKPSSWPQAGFLILTVPILTGLFQFIQSKMMAPQAAPQASKTTQTDTMAQMQSQMTYLMPVMIAFFAYSFPLGISLYWNTFTIIGIIQQYVVAGAGSLNKYLPVSLRRG